MRHSSQAKVVFKQSGPFHLLRDTPVPSAPYGTGSAGFPDAQEKNLSLLAENRVRVPTRAALSYQLNCKGAFRHCVGVCCALERSTSAVQCNDNIW